jgi:hypothetical protein
MKIIFTCSKGHSSESDIEEMLDETIGYYIVTCRCSYCGRLNRIKILKDQFPKRSTDQNNGGHNGR